MYHTLVRMLLAKNDQAFPMGPVGLFEKLGDSIIVGQVEMATDHGGWRPEWIGVAGNPVRRLSGLPMEEKEG